MQTFSAFLHHGIPLVLLGTLPLLVASCSEEDPGTNPTAGTSGTSAGAGKGGSGGSSGGSGGSAGTASAGKGGTGGTGGTAGGTAGAATGGSAGSSAGSATTGGTAGSSAGSGSGGQSAGGAGGTSGASSGGMGGMSAGGAAGAAGSASGAAGTSGGSGGSGSGTLTLTSPSHMEGAMFGDKYTCAAAGFNGSLLPELNWTPGPSGTQSYAITFIDVTLTEGMSSMRNLGYHWVIYNIPATVTSLAEEFKDAGSIGASQNSNYLGPCPNVSGGNETHTYEFTIYALDTPTITITGTGTAAVSNAEMLLEADNLASAKLTGTSNASPP